MTEIKTVAVNRIDPNPFRDGGSGQATWESVAEAYGYDEGKLKQLEESYRTNGAWPGIIAREAAKGRFQIAFGHHRLEAARRLELKSLPLIVDQLDDNQMLTFMAHENSEEYGHDFALGVMNAVEAVVRAYGAGKIQLEEVPKDVRKSTLRMAPSFVSGVLGDAQGPIYSGTSVGAYLGWLQSGNTKAGVQASERVWVALSALELIELGVLKRTQLKGLGSTQARELVQLTRRKMEQEREKQEIQKEFLEKQRKQAEAEDNKNKARALAAKLAEHEEATRKSVVKAGQEAVSVVREFHSPDKSMREALQEAANKLGVAPKPVPKKSRVVDLGRVDILTRAVDAFLLEQDPVWLRVLSLAEESNAGKTWRNLEEALERLSVRAKDRAKELRRKRGERNG